MLKFLGLMITIVVLVGGATHQTLAQEWTTYYNPDLKFAIDYPSYSGGAPTNITESTDEVHFELPPLTFGIKAYSDSPMGPEEFAVVMQQTILKEYPESELVQSVETVLYNGELGYGFTVYTPSDGFYIEIIYFYSPNIEFDQYRVQFVGTNPVGGPISEYAGEFTNTIRLFS